MIVQSRCSTCGETYDEEAFFGHSERRFAYLRRRPICFGCQQEKRDAGKRCDRWVKKANGTIARHARRLGLAADVLRLQFGWSPDRLIHDGKHAHKNGCPYCKRLFRDMNGGDLGNITIDVVDPRQEPYYVVNTKWVCATCNKEKQRTPPELWARKLACWDKWERRKAYLAKFGPDQPQFAW